MYTSQNAKRFTHRDILLKNENKIICISLCADCTRKSRVLKIHVFLAYGQILRPGRQIVIKRHLATMRMGLISGRIVRYEPTWLILSRPV